MTSDVQDHTLDLLGAPETADAESRLRLSSERSSFLARVSRTVGASLQTDRAVDLILGLLVPDVLDWAQIVLRDAGVLHCHATLAGGRGPRGSRRAGGPRGAHVSSAAAGRGRPGGGDDRAGVLRSQTT